MAANDLNAPLGQDKKKKRLSLPIAAPQLLAGALALCALLVVGWIVFADDPLGGEPVAVVATTPAEMAASKTGGAGGHHHDGGPSLAKNAATAKAASPPPGSRTITIINGSNGTRQDVIIPDNAAGRAQKAPIDTKLLQPTAQGAIPKVAADGSRALTRYASALKVPPNRQDSPRIAVVVTGLGIGDSATAAALEKLPAPVSLAFMPYGHNLEALAERARAANHELLLQVPMEPLDYPDNDPGPHTLLTSLTGTQNIERLHWLMGRMKGYVGVTNYMGARFTASEQALMPVLREVAKRGLIYVDDGSSSRSIAGQFTGALSLPFARADTRLDAVPTPSEIERALTRLEMTARAQGSAVGYASAQPAAIAAISNWAKTVQSRGFQLVPITRIAVKAKSS